MRSTNMKRLTSFFTFDLPVNYKYLYLSFCQTHENQRHVYSNWPAEATCRKLISDYWSKAVLHYVLLVGLSAITSSLFSIFYDLSGRMYFPALVVIGALTYLPLYFIIYRPTFSEEFLPKLETVIAEYEGREQVKLDKCKQDQPSNPAAASPILKQKRS